MNRQIERTGLEAVGLVTQLLHRVRLAHPTAGVWEAADIEWWWRMPRASDSVPQRFWLDAEGPVAAALLTDWSGTWGLDPIVLPGIDASLRGATIDATLERATELDRTNGSGLNGVEALVRDDDLELIELLQDRGFQPTNDRGGLTWMDADARPPKTPPPVGFSIVDRGASPEGPHPLARRSSQHVERRLRETSLYDPALDLSIRNERGEVAGYALFWFDPVTLVGLLEPMRVEDAWQRQGLGRALVLEGLDRLVARGATRLKVGFGLGPGRALYTSVGFRIESTTTAWGRPATRPQPERGRPA